MLLPLAHLLERCLRVMGAFSHLEHGLQTAQVPVFIPGSWGGIFLSVHHRLFLLSPKRGDHLKH
jgi:hypothetical protein